MTIIRLTGRGLTLDALEAVAQRRARVSLDPRARRAMAASRRVVERAIRGGEKVYGVTTGFGKFAVAERGPRQGVNPRTGERIQIAASRVPRCTTRAASSSPKRRGALSGPSRRSSARCRP